MLKLLVLFAVITTSMIVNMPKAEAAANFKWYPNGTCGLMTPQGNLIDKVDIEHCEKALGTNYKWYSNGTCGYMTSKGDLINKVDVDICAQKLGTHYSWYPNGTCGWMTSKNDLINKVDIDECARRLGTYYKWYANGTCGYMTSKGALINKVDIDYCLFMDEKASAIMAVDSSPRIEGKDFNRSPSVVEAYGRAKAGKQ